MDGSTCATPITRVRNSVFPFLGYDYLTTQQGVLTAYMVKSLPAPLPAHLAHRLRAVTAKAKALTDSMEAGTLTMSAYCQRLRDASELDQKLHRALREAQADQTAAWCDSKMVAKAVAGVEARLTATS